MAINSKDIETLWGRYQREESIKGISVAQYFESNGIPYHAFEKWYKKRFRQPDVVDCVVEGMPEVELRGTRSSEAVVPSPEPEAERSSFSVTVSHVNICLSNGMRIDHHKLSYPDLLRFIQLLEPLCSA